MPEKPSKKPPTESGKRTLNVSKKLHAKLRVKAATKDLGLSEFVEGLLIEGMKASPRIIAEFKRMRAKAPRP